MLNNITMGQYYPTDSAVHRLDPRTKILLTVFFIVGVFMIHSLWGYALALGSEAPAGDPDPYVPAEPLLLGRGHAAGALGLSAHHAGGPHPCGALLSAPDLSGHRHVASDADHLPGGAVRRP